MYSNHMFTYAVYFSAFNWQRLMFIHEHVSA